MDFSTLRTSPEKSQSNIARVSGLEETVETALAEGKDGIEVERLCEMLRASRKSETRGIETQALARKAIGKGVKLAEKRIAEKEVGMAMEILAPIQSAVAPMPPAALLPELFALHSCLSLIYRHSGDLASALHHITTALSLPALVPSLTIPVSTAHLSLCFLQSLMNKHQAALQSALTAAAEAQKEMQTSRNVKDTKSVWAVACHNVGVELEHLKRNREAVQWFQRAAKVLDRSSNHELQEKVKSSLLAVTASKRKDSESRFSTRRKSANMSDVSSQHRGSSGSVKLVEQVPSSRRSASLRRVEKPQRPRLREKGNTKNFTPSSIYRTHANQMYFPVLPQDTRVPPLSLHVPDLNNTDQDLQDLAALGLLDYTLTPSPPARPTIRVRGRKRPPGVPRIQSELPSAKLPRDEPDLWQDAEPVREIHRNTLSLPEIERSPEPVIEYTAEVEGIGMESPDLSVITGGEARVVDTAAVQCIQACARRFLCLLQIKHLRDTHRSQPLLRQPEKPAPNKRLFTVSVSHEKEELPMASEKPSEQKERKLTEKVEILPAVLATDPKETISPKGPPAKVDIPKPVPDKSHSEASSVTVATTISRGDSFLTPAEQRPKFPSAILHSKSIDPAPLHPPSASRAHISAAPTVEVHSTDDDNVLGTENYRRVLVALGKDERRKEERAAVLIQSHFRSFLARQSPLRSSNTSRQVVSRFFTISKDHSVALTLYFCKDHYEVAIVNLDTASEVTTAIPTSKSKTLEDAKRWITALVSDRVEETEKKPNEVEEKKRETAVVRIQKCVRGMLSRMRYLKKQAENRWKLQFCRRKVLNSEEFFIAIYSFRSEMTLVESYKVNKTLQLKYRCQTQKFAKEQLRNMYKLDPTLEMIYEDCEIDDGVVKLIPRVRYSKLPQSRALLPTTENPLIGSESRSILRASKKLDHRMWVVTVVLLHQKSTQMTPLASDVLEFSAFCGGVQNPLKASAPLGNLALKTKQPVEAVHPISFLTINHLLTVSDCQLVLDWSAPLPDIDYLVSLVQAQVRGYLVRSRVPIASRPYGLIACASCSLSFHEYVLCAYSDPKGVILEARKRGTSEVNYGKVEGDFISELPDNINRKKMVEVLLFPRVRVERDGEKGSLRLETVDEEWVGSRIDAILVKSTGGKSANVLTIRRAQSVLSEICALRLKPVEDWSYFNRKTIKKVTFPPTQLSGESSKPQTPSLLSFASGLSESACRAVPKSLFEIAEEAKNEPTPEKVVGRNAIGEAAQREVVVRSGVEIEGELCSATVFTAMKELIIEVIHPNTPTPLRIALAPPTFQSKSDRDLHCSDLLSRLFIPSGAAKVMQLAPAADSPAVIYRRSHFLAGRNFVITVCDEGAEVVFWANESRKCGNLRLSWPKPQEAASEPTLKSVLRLIPRLQVVICDGTEALVLLPA